LPRPPDPATLPGDAPKGKRLDANQERLVRWLIREAIRKIRGERGR
jgi:hypothetical protein